MTGCASSRPAPAPGIQPILSGAEGLPLLALSREDKGRVALLLSDHAWLWARGYQEGGPYLDLLRRLGHWLMKEPALEEEALRAQTTGRGREVRVERQTMADQAEPVTVTGPTGKVTTLTLKPGEPGLFTATFEAESLGLHTLRSGNLVAFVSVGPANPRELADVFSDTERLKAVAEGSGGSIRRVAEAGGAVQVPRLATVRSGRLVGRGLDRLPAERQRQHPRRRGLSAGAGPRGPGRAGRRPARHVAGGGTARSGGVRGLARRLIRRNAAHRLHARRAAAALRPMSPVSPPRPRGSTHRRQPARDSADRDRTPPRRDAPRRVPPARPGPRAGTGRDAVDAGHPAGRQRPVDPRDDADGPAEIRPRLQAFRLCRPGRPQGRHRAPRRAGRRSTISTSSSPA